MSFAPFGNTRLKDACLRGDIDAVRNLLKTNNVNVNYQNSGRVSPLYCACQNGHINIVKLLLENGASIDIEMYGGFTPLYVACQNGHIDIVKLLLEQGASINNEMNSGATPLYVACERGQTDIVKLLLEHGASIDKEKDGGLTPLHVACYFGRIEVVSLLLDQGANHKLKTHGGKTAKDYAQEKGYFDIVKLFPAKKKTEPPQDSKKPNQKEIEPPNDSPLHENSNQDSDRKKVDMLRSEVEILRRKNEILEARDIMRKAMSSLQRSNADIPYSYVEECTNDFAQGRVLGKGGFGCVYFAQDKVDEMIQFAVKKVSHDSRHLGWREIEALRRVAHPNIVRIYGTSTEGNDKKSDVYLLLEYASRGDLGNVLSSDEGRRKLSSNARVNILCQVAQAMHFLHSGGVADENKQIYEIFHRDINPSNIWLDDKRNVKLMVDCELAQFKLAGGVKEADITSADTSLKTMTANHSLESNHSMCPHWKARKVDFEGRCDVYSFGVVMMEIITGCLEDDLVHKYRVSEKLQDNFDKMAGSDWDCAKKQLSDLAISCVEYELNDRPTVIELIETLSYIQMGRRKILDAPFVSPRPDALGTTERTCQICNRNCNTGKIIACHYGHEVDSSCFCNRSMKDRRDFFKCPMPICNSDIVGGLAMLATKIPVEYVMLLNFEMHSKQEQKLKEVKTDVQVVNDKLVEMWKQMTLIAAENHPCPCFVLIVPTTGNKEKRTLENFLSKPVRIFFLCEDSWEPVEAFETSMKREWLGKLAPLLKISIQIFAKAAADPSSQIVMAAIEFVCKLVGKTFDQKFSDFDRKIESGIGLHPTDRSVADGFFQDEEVIAIVKEAYEALAEEAEKEKNSEWKKKMKPVLSPDTGKTIKWVLKDR